jgi:hypothetical protein
MTGVRATAIVECAAPGCGEAVVRTTNRGRPQIYCSPACRPAGPHVRAGMRGCQVPRLILMHVSPDLGRWCGRNPDHCRYLCAKVIAEYGPIRDIP